MLKFTALLALAPAGGAANPIAAFLPMVFLFVMLYFLMIRPQQQQQKKLNEMIKNLQKGDRIMTAGGIIGTIAGIQDDYVVLKVGGDDVKVEILKSAITGKRS